MCYRTQSVNTKFVHDVRPSEADDVDEVAAGSLRNHIYIVNCMYLFVV